jgi:3-hydroxybutyryl-CoA dehydrogenase
MNVTVLGAGVMGRNIARVFLHSGARVALYSRSDETLGGARRALDNSVRTDALSTSTAIDAAVAEARLVIESVPERLTLKRGILAEVEMAAPEGALIATNTSSLSLDDLAASLRRPERFLGLHWFNPAHLIPLVEVVPAAATESQAVEWSVHVLKRAGKRPRVLQRAVPGFLANRLQYALIREALQLLEDGVADAETIDGVITDCLGPRWAVIGPLRSTDLAGVETAIAVAEQLYGDLSCATRPQRPLRELREQGRLGVRTGEGFHAYPDPQAAVDARDRGLAAVLDALRDAAARR